jgi:hypothetical protein
MFERRWQPADRLPTEALHMPGLDAGFHPVGFGHRCSCN